MNQVPSVEREPAAVELRRVKIVFAALYFFLCWHGQCLAPLSRFI